MVPGLLAITFNTSTFCDALQPQFFPETKLGVHCVKQVENPEPLGTFDRLPTYLRHLHWNSGECGGPSAELCLMRGRYGECCIVGSPDFQGPLNGGVSNRGGFPIWTRPSFFVLFCPFWDFPDFSGIFPICSGMVRGFSQLVFFLFLGLLRAPTRISPERVRDTIWTFPKKSGKPPGLETPRFSFSQDFANFTRLRMKVRAHASDPPGSCLSDVCPWDNWVCPWDQPR